MGPLTLPASGEVYVDANGFIYTVEQIEPYFTLLRGLWLAVQTGQIAVITSELTLLEVLIKPIADANASLEAAFRAALLRSPDVRSLPVTRAVLERAARLRASTRLKTPDAIHAATALEAGAALVLTNDSSFRRVPGLAVTVLADLLSRP
jgi:predicted nucleic acid-binding protein